VATRGARAALTRSRGLLFPPRSHAGLAA
jgi:hypothetical protein